MITGTLTQDADGQSFTATVSTLLFDVARIAVVPNPHKTADNHPDHHLEVRTPRGRTMRVGAMWRATSERSGREYHSLTLTDRMGRTWRMNAVRGEDTPEGTWRIVPLAGGEPEPVALTGRLEALDDGNLAGSLGGYDFDLDFVAVENPHKAEEHHPDWHMEARSPAGVAVRVGSIWRARSERTGNAYLSMAFSTPTGTRHRANALRREGTPEDVFEVVALTPAAETLVEG